jgi:hypothetical protein
LVTDTCIVFPCALTKIDGSKFLREIAIEKNVNPEELEKYDEKPGSMRRS